MCGILLKSDMGCCSTICPFNQGCTANSDLIIRSYISHDVTNPHLIQFLSKCHHKVHCFGYFHVVTEVFSPTTSLYFGLHILNLWIESSDNVSVSQYEQIHWFVLRKRELGWSISTYISKKIIIQEVKKSLFSAHKINLNTEMTHIYHQK